MAGPAVSRRLRTTDVVETFSLEFLFTLRVFARNLIRVNSVRNIFVFIFRFDPLPGIRSRALRLINHHTAYYTMAISSITHIYCKSGVFFYREITVNGGVISLFLLWCFLLYQKMCTLFKKMQFRVRFLKMLRALKGWYVLF